MSGVGLVIVSHSRRLAEGVVELAGQMAEGVAIVAAGGTDDDGIGTSYEKIERAVAEARGDGGSAAILCDLGSAVMTAETFLDTLDEDDARRVRLVDAPLVEGAVAAAVAAASGEDLDAVARAAEGAGHRDAPEDAAGLGELQEAARPAADPEPAPGAGSAGEDPAGGAGASQAERRSLVLVNDEGLHARPAAQLAKAAAGFDATIRVNGVDAKSLLRIMGLGLAKGAAVELEASGPQAAEAVAALAALVEDGFGEQGAEA